MSQNPSALHIGQPLVLGEWLDLDDARQACRMVAQNRRNVEQLREDAEKALEEADTDAAVKEQAYHKKLALVYAELKASFVGTSAERSAEADKRASDQLFEYRVAQGVVRALKERIRGIDKRLDGMEGERAMLRLMMEWSMKLRIDGRETYR